MGQAVSNVLGSMLNDLEKFFDDNDYGVAPDSLDRRTSFELEHRRDVRDPISQLAQTHPEIADYEPDEDVLDQGWNEANVPEGSTGEVPAVLC